MKKCENCSSLTDGNYGSGRFCSSACARAFSTKGKRKDINAKVSLKMTGMVSPRKGTGVRNRISEKIICVKCDSEFIAKHSMQTVCSRECHRKHKTIEQNLKSSNSMKTRVENGTHVGWQSRKVRSYAEKFFETVLVNNEIKFDTEYKIKKRDLGFEDSSNYFLDFYLTDFNVDLEIDGKQHEYPDRKESDKIRDEALNKFGIKVYRIKWKNPNNESNKEYIKNEIEKFLKFIGM